MRGLSDTMESDGFLLSVNSKRFCGEKGGAL